MPHPRSDNRPLDRTVKERLHLKGENPAALRFVRAAIHAGDTISRVVTSRPFFALRESEAMLRQMGGLQGQALIRAVLEQKDGTYIMPHGLVHVPESGAVVIAATHPTGIFDFVAHADALLARRPDLKVVANQEVERFLGSKLIVPVRIDKQNRATSGRRTRASMIRHLQQGGALLVFGSGRVPDRRSDCLVEPNWRRGASTVSRDTDAMIVPAALDARNSDAYYRIRALARFLSGGNDDFGAMIASLRYMSELLAKLGGRYDVHYGAPLAAGTAPDRIKARAENLVPGLYASA